MKLCDLPRQRGQLKRGVSEPVGVPGDICNAVGGMGAIHLIDHLGGSIGEVRDSSSLTIILFGRPSSLPAIVPIVYEAFAANISGRASLGRWKIPIGNSILGKQKSKTVSNGKDVFCD